MVDGKVWDFVAESSNLSSCTILKWKEDFMTRTKLYYSNRIHKLKSRNAVANARIIKKLERRIRLLDKT